MAQSTETVHLKNGSIIHGVIIEQAPGKMLKIQTSDGSVFVYTYEEVEKITKNVAQKTIKTHAPSGPSIADPTYVGSVDAGYSVDVSGIEGAGRVEISTSHGCLLIPHLYMGAGVGFQYYHSASLLSIPIFADFRVYPMTGDIKPFVNFRIGYSVGDIDGLYVSPSVGVSIKRFDISCGYTMQKVTVYYDSSDYGTWKVSGNLGGVTFKIGFRF